MSERRSDEHAALLLRPLDEQYFIETNKQEFPPIVVDNTKGNQLRFVGTKHVNDPSDLFYERLDGQWEAFVNRDDTAHKKLAVLEGWRPGQYDQSLTDEQVIRSRGETGYIEKKALESDIEIARFEPDMSEEFEQLCQRFEPHHVYYWLVARQAVQWGREDPVPRKLPWNGQKRAERHNRITETKLAQYQGLLETILGHSASFGEVVSSFDMVRDTHEGLFGNKLDWNDITHFSKHANPVGNASVLNDIHRMDNRRLYLYNKYKGMDLLYADSMASLLK